MFKINFIKTFSSFINYGCRKINFSSKSDGTCIYAVASGLNQRCGVSILRLSGKNSIDILNKLTKNSNNSYEPRKMYLKNIWHPLTKEKLDRGLVVFFKEPNSFTGETVCEFHIHGGPAVITGLMSALETFENVRYAEPGEFSRRAFLNGCMDLVEIEGLADLINAETEMQRKQALLQMEGSLSNLYKDWRTKIIKCLANVEAFIDFSEDENIEENVLEDVDIMIRELIHSIQSHLNDNRKGERLRNGVKVVIIGQTNAGKSSLLNAICRRPAAIVSSIPGTTRDIIESAVNISGYPILLSDTAGLRTTSDIIEIEGVRRAKEKIDSADLLIILVDVKEHFETLYNIGLNKFIDKHIKEHLNLKFDESSGDNQITNKEILISFNKKDLLDSTQLNHFNNLIKSGNNSLDKNIQISVISCLSQDSSLNNIGDLLDDLTEKLKKLCPSSISETPTITQQRHRDNLRKCLTCLKDYLNAADHKSNSTNKDQNIDYALNAEKLRIAAKWIGNITGHVTTEQILDVIFRDFCIGK